jgi:hypothetical protein
MRRLSLTLSKCCALPDICLIVTRQNCEWVEALATENSIRDIIELVLRKRCLEHFYPREFLDVKHYAIEAFVVWSFGPVGREARDTAQSEAVLR